MKTWKRQMIVAFATIQLRDVCEQHDRARRQLPLMVAEALQRRLADLRAASTAADILVGRPRVVEKGGLEEMVIQLAEGYLLSLTPNHIANPETDAGRIQWSGVSRVKIVGIKHEDD